MGTLKTHQLLFCLLEGRGTRHSRVIPGLSTQLQAQSHRPGCLTPRAPCGVGPEYVGGSSGVSVSIWTPPSWDIHVLENYFKVNQACACAEVLETCWGSCSGKVPEILSGKLPVVSHCCVSSHVASPALVAITVLVSEMDVLKDSFQMQHSRPSLYVEAFTQTFYFIYLFL